MPDLTRGGLPGFLTPDRSVAPFAALAMALDFFKFRAPVVRATVSVDDLFWDGRGFEVAMHEFPRKWMTATLYYRDERSAFEGANILFFLRICRESTKSGSMPPGILRQ
ncbi:MAG: hypothetical protein WCP99_13475 [Burkholderiales bacterium]